jgi:sugar lactone lactonase YvrE
VANFVDRDGLNGSDGIAFDSSSNPPLRSGSHSHKLRDFFTNSYQLALGFAVDSADRIYVTLPPYVYRFSAKGGPASLKLGERCAYGYWTGFPEGLGRASLCSPTGLAVGPGNELFVSDAGTNRIMVFDNP